MAGVGGDAIDGALGAVRGLAIGCLDREHPACQQRVGRPRCDRRCAGRLDGLADGDLARCRRCIGLVLDMEDRRRGGVREDTGCGFGPGRRVAGVFHFGDGVLTRLAVRADRHEVREGRRTVRTAGGDGGLGAAVTGRGCRERPTGHGVTAGDDGAEFVDDGLLYLDLADPFPLIVGELGDSVDRHARDRVGRDGEPGLGDFGDVVGAGGLATGWHVDDTSERRASGLVGDRVDRAGRARCGAGQGEHPASGGGAVGVLIPGSAVLQVDRLLDVHITGCCFGGERIGDRASVGRVWVTGGDAGVWRSRDGVAGSADFVDGVGAGDAV